MKGFTLIEFLIVIAAVVILSAAIAASFSAFSKDQALASSAENILSVLREARSKTLSSQGGSQFGVHFDSGAVILFKGTVYSSSDPENSAVQVSSLVEISAVSLNGGGSDVIFQKLTGETENYGTITLRLKTNTEKIKAITIKATGICEI